MHVVQPALQREGVLGKEIHLLWLVVCIVTQAVTSQSQKDKNDGRVHDVQNQSTRARVIEGAGHTCTAKGKFVGLIKIVWILTLNRHV